MCVCVCVCIIYIFVFFCTYVKCAYSLYYIYIIYTVYIIYPFSAAYQSCTALKESSLVMSYIRMKPMAPL